MQVEANGFHFMQLLKATAYLSQYRISILQFYFTFYYMEHRLVFFKVV